MRKIILSVSLALIGTATARAQTVITPPSGGVAIVAGGHYAAGTVFSNGMAYPAGTAVQANAVVTPGIQYVTPAGYSYTYGPTTGGYVYQTTYPNSYSRYGTSYYPNSWSANYYYPNVWSGNAWGWNGVGNSSWSNGYYNPGYGYGPRSWANRGYYGRRWW